MRKWVLYILLTMLQLNCSMNVVAQIVFYQDIFRGEVSVVGVSSGDASGIVTLPTGMSNHSSIKKIFLVCYGDKGYHFTPTQRYFAIDSVPFSLKDLQPTAFLVGNNTYIPAPTDYDGHITYVKDLTPYIDTINSTVKIDWIDTPIAYPPDNCPSCNIAAPLLVILHEDNTMPTVNFALIINTQNNDNEIELTLNNLNEPDYTKPLALGIHSDRLGGGINDGYSFKINNVYAGKIISSNKGQYNLFYGAVGCFHYGNGVLTGLTDDNPDSIFYGPNPAIDTADGLATINSYIQNNQINPLNFKVAYTNQSNGQHNIFISYSLTYSTPCNPFPVNISSDTTICQGQTVQLNASGGQNYEWQSTTGAANGLSCATCANPVFSGDSSAVYTVRVWNSDSCSVVKPVRVTVNPKPKGLFSTVQTACGEQKGVIKMQGNPALQTFYAIAENGDTLQSSYQNIPQVGAGSYTVFYVDTNGCQSNDTVVKVDYFNNVQANFTVNPTSGVAPLNVQIDNTSQNATSYQWSLDSVNIPAPPTVFDSSGMYRLQLIAYDENPACNDTTFTTILVYDSLVLSIPNVFTPNGDGINDIFTITSNLPAHAKIYIFNRWGNEILASDHVLNAGANTIWNGKTTNGVQATDGVYFYKIEAVDFKGNSKEINGFFHLVK